MSSNSSNFSIAYKQSCPIGKEGFINVHLVARKLNQIELSREVQ